MYGWICVAIGMMSAVDAVEQKKKEEKEEKKHKNIILLETEI